MPTNKERRDVAARLRVLASHVPADAELVLDALDLYEGECIDGFEPRCVERLADLIEPEERTCTFSVYQTGDGQFPACSVCGYEAAREECEDYVGVVYYEKRHCPNCGAKVMER